MFPPGALPAGAVPVGNLPPEMMRALQASLAEAFQDRDAARRQFFNGNEAVSDDAVDAAIAQFREHLQDPEQASQMMAMLAMTIWSLSVVMEITRTLRLLYAICRLPHGRDALEADSAGSVYVRHMSTGRKVLMILLQLTRLGIAVALFVVGNIYLV